MEDRNAQEIRALREQLDEAKKTIAEKDELISQLEDAALSGIDGADQGNADHNAEEIETLKKQLEEANRTITEKDKTISQLEDAALSGIDGADRGEADRNAEEIKSLKEQLDFTKEQLDLLMEEMPRLESDSRELQDMQTKLADLTTKLEEAKKTITEKDALISQMEDAAFSELVGDNDKALEDLKNSYEETIKQMQNKIDQLMVQDKANEEKIIAAKQAQQAAEAQLQTTNSEIERLKKDSADSAKASEDLKNTLEGTIMQLQTRIDQLVAHDNMDEEKLLAAEQARIAAQQAWKAVEAQLQAQLQAAEQARKTAEAQLQTTEQARSTAEARVQSAIGEIERLRRDGADFKNTEEETIKQLEERIKQQNARVDELVAHDKVDEDKIVASAQAQATVEVQLQAAKDEIERLKKEEETVKQLQTRIGELVTHDKEDEEKIAAEQRDRETVTAQLTAQINTLQQTMLRRDGLIPLVGGFINDKARAAVDGRQFCSFILPFPITMWNFTTNKIFIGINGTLGLDGGIPNGMWERGLTELNRDVKYGLYPYWGPWMIRSGYPGGVYYSLLGEAPKRRLVITWNVLVNGTYNEYSNFNCTFEEGWTNQARFILHKTARDGLCGVMGPPGTMIKEWPKGERKLDTAYVVEIHTAYGTLKTHKYHWPDFNTERFGR